MIEKRNHRAIALLPFKQRRQTHTQGLRLEMGRTGDGLNNLEMEMPKTENRYSTLALLFFIKNIKVIHAYCKKNFF